MSRRVSQGDEKVEAALFRICVIKIFLFILTIQDTRLLLLLIWKFWIQTFTRKERYPSKQNWTFKFNDKSIQYLPLIQSWSTIVFFPNLHSSLVLMPSLSTSTSFHFPGNRKQCFLDNVLFLCSCFSFEVSDDFCNNWQSIFFFNWERSLKNSKGQLNREVYDE